MRFVKSKICKRASRLVWARGLKQRQRIDEWPKAHVAPRVGAWIETSFDRSHGLKTTVAPRVGAWIETIFIGLRYRTSVSRLVWARGLKLAMGLTFTIVERRASCGRVD